MHMTWSNGPAATMHLDNFQSLCVALFSRLPAILHTSKCDLAKERAMGGMTEPSKLNEEMSSCQMVCQRGRWVLIRSQRKRQMTIIKSVLPSRSMSIHPKRPLFLSLRTAGPEKRTGQPTSVRLG